MIEFVWKIMKWLANIYHLRAFFWACILAFSNQVLLLKSITAYIFGEYPFISGRINKAHNLSIIDVSLVLGSQF
jgi:hypothetical protein